MNDELREAAEFVLANVGWAVSYPHLEKLIVSAADVARAYLAEHPADSELPITEDWLREACQNEPHEQAGYLDVSRGIYRVEEMEDTWTLWCCGVETGLFKTRGQLRNLLAALKEPT